MAPLADELAAVVSRDVRCSSGYYYSGGYCYRYSSWYWWGRWVFAGVVILFIIVLLFLLGCMNARRRRRRGLQPRYGTGWMGGPPAYTPGNYNQPPPPQYQQQQPQYTGNTFNSNEGYYGTHNEGINLQQPQQSYYPRSGDDSGYAPPPGPPPSKIH
ncbi:hypothetical protein UCRPA7_2058 [Phaeoacremonium minimum UCRPA7]|uniref:Uncharacterized protein n=1 Tax=Phaeoacremonium minimum (strain UCR-PA7) TaxID=1286976 RepID=R8BT21_PHAM7|nr:hypothetical protein UCRPA7_2058 [Phaeoacremonium minimum UCRPA7]EOO02491.1 hypothetical protein UCRPA7_2058 [Phaeoacremonium minimum UCRPA7]